MKKSKQPLPRQLLPKAEPGSSSASPTLEGSSPSASASASANGGQTQSTSKRRCISSACMPCRRRKSKCDGAQPSCSACLSVYSSQCYYDLDSDHRRKGALKRDIAHLTEQKEAQTIILDAIRNGSEADVDDIVQFIRASPDDDFQSLAEEVQKIGLQSAKLAKKLEPQALESTFADYAGEAELSTKGQSQHYGHTSNLALIGGGDHSVPARTLEDPKTWSTVTNNCELILHLLDLYFLHLHSFYALFSKEIFLHGMETKNLQHCTPLLVNVILALGCTWSGRLEARRDPNNPATLGDHFFDEAKRLLSLEQEAQLTTIQALGLMSMFEAQNDRDSSGWRYVGQMMSMVIELRLHVSHAGQTHRILSSMEMQARKVTFWGAFALDTLWAFCIGRISGLPLAAVRLEKPAISERSIDRLRKAGESVGLVMDSAALELEFITSNILVQLSLLSEIVSDIVHMFYAPKDRITSRRLQHFHEKFLSWFRKLPECLQINPNRSTLPQVFTLHTYYHNCVLHLFRPFLRVSFVPSSKTPHQICTESANNISQKTRLCIQQHGPHRLIFVQAHCIMSAAIIHLVNLSAKTLLQHNERMTADLADAIQDLSNMHKTFPVVIRYIKALRHLIHQWLPLIPPSIRQAMISSGMSQTPNPLANESLMNIANRTTMFDSAHKSQSSAYATITLPTQTPLAGAKETLSDHNSLLYPESSWHNPINSIGSNIQVASQFFWTPFPHRVDGIPLPLPSPERRQPMDIGTMLDSGVDAAWAQLARDGFTIDHGMEYGVIP